MDMKALYDHTIELIELTKLLERDVCDTMTVTNSLYRDYVVGVNPATVTTSSGLGSYKGNFMTPYLPGAEIALPAFGSVFNDPSISNYRVTQVPADDSSRTRVISPSGVEVYNEPSSTIGSVVLSETGKYQIAYGMMYYLQQIVVAPGSQPVNYYQTYYGYIYIDIIQGAQASTPWTITEVVNRILSAGVTRRVGIDTQKYVFDETQAAQYANVKAPEFFFTRGTLWDALSTVGGYIHAIPRLVDQNREDGRLTVRFDELNSDEVYDMSNLPSVRYYDEQISGEEYCEEIDSPAQNLLNTTDKATGAVTEPSGGGWRAVNCSSGEYTIAANTMTFITDQPFYQVTGLEIKWGQNGTALNAFPYLYEQAEYSVLSSYDGEVYPYSKGWALCYTQGGNEITGLNFTLTTASGANELANNYAIVNILKALGVDINNDADFANNLFYRITYIPQSELRVSQKKPYLTHVGKGTLIYNQGGNTIESEYFGQKMKGAIARIGNVIRRRTFICNKFVKVPKIGQTYSPDGVPEKISNVDCSYEKMYIKVTVTSVPNFNRLAEYTGVNSNYRLYDISEKQSVDRFVHYEESCVISNNKIENTGSPLITLDGLSAYAATFRTSTQEENPLKTDAFSMTSLAGRTEDDAETGAHNNEIGLGCASFGFGNSLVFYANMQDNYGAGRQSSDDYWQASTKKRTSKQVQYGDGLGNISTAEISFGVGFSGNAITMPFNYPANMHVDVNTEWFSTGGKSFFISKDSREALHFAYQLHHQADNFDIVIGSGLSSANNLVSAKAKAMMFVWLMKPLDLINPQIRSKDDYIQKSSLPELIDPSGDWKGFGLSSMTNHEMTTVYGWAIVTRDENFNVDEVVIGQNYPDGLFNESSTKPLYFNFVDNSVLATLGMAE